MTDCEKLAELIAGMDDSPLKDNLQAVYNANCGVAEPNSSGTGDPPPGGSGPKK